MYTVAGVTVSLKKDEQSAVPDLVGKELATTARRQLSLLQAKRVVVAAKASCATQHRMATVENCMVMSSIHETRKTKILRSVHSNFSTLTEDEQRVEAIL